MSFKRLLTAFVPTSVLLILLAAHAPAYEPPTGYDSQPGERILEYHSDITVHPDSTMTVTETITVRAEGYSIKHGIYRDFPTIYKTESGGRYVTAFDVTGVSMDGSPEEHFTKRMENGKRLYIGKKDEFVSHGVHTYEITYNTDRQLGFFETHDELYWNVTGNGWIFPIDRASATVRLPSGARPDELVAYTGLQGAKGRDYEDGLDRDGNAEFATTRPLAAYEGLTVSVSWPKGFVSEPTGYMKARYMLRDNGYLLLAIFGVIAVLGYYAYAWNKVGRDPEKGHIVPLYEPPDGLSPAAVRYIMKHGYDNTAFTAAIVNLAVKGFVRIVQTGRKKYELERTAEPTPAKSGMPEGERIILSRIFAGRQRISLGGYEPSVSSANTGLGGRLKREYSVKYYLQNTGYLMPGVGMTVLFVWGVSYLSDNSFLLAAPLVLINVVFYFLIKAPTVTGRKMMDRIDGFRVFLKATEEDRLNRLNPPERTPELFEKYLPYAIALDCENEWADQFSGEVLQSAIERNTGRWYRSGVPFGRVGFAGALTGSLSSGFGGAISSAATPPGSSSGGGGGGGGGSSGGGGGGGGGGGW